MPEAKLITCFLWRSSAVSLPLEADESVVSSVIQLACDDPEGVNFSGVTVALSHSAIEIGGYELVMKELTNSENNTWKDLKATNVTRDPSGMLLSIEQINNNNKKIGQGPWVHCSNQLEISKCLVRPSEVRCYTLYTVRSTSLNCA